MVYSFSSDQKTEFPFYQEMGKQLNGKEITDNFSRKNSYRYCICPKWGEEGVLSLSQSKRGHLPVPLSPSDLFYGFCDPPQPDQGLRWFRPVPEVERDQVEEGGTLWMEGNQEPFRVRPKSFHQYRRSNRATLI